VGPKSVPIAGARSLDETQLADEVARRDRKSAQLRSKAAHLDPQMQLHAWDDTAAITFDQQLWAELTSLRFLADAYTCSLWDPSESEKRSWPTP
jgi:IstB-like ATP binding protein